MDKTLEKVSIKLESLLRNNKFIVANRDDLLFYMFGGTPLEDEINKLYAKHSRNDYFLIVCLEILVSLDNCR